MGDDLFNEEQEDPETVTVNRQELQNLSTQYQQVQAELEQTRMALNSASQAIPEPAPPVPTQTSPHDMSPDEALKELANDPAGFAQKVADGRIAQAIGDQFEPIIRPMMETTHQNILAAERLKFDMVTGVGKFDQIIMPQLQRDIDSLSKTNSAALGSAETIKALVNRLEGQNRYAINKAELDLVDVRRSNDDAMVAKVVQQLPPSMRPRSAGAAASLDEDGTLFFKEIEAATGVKEDPAEFLALQNTGGGLQEYLDAVATTDTEETP